MLNPILAIGVLILGFILLVKGADFFVDGSSSVAKTLKVPGLIIGMTVVAMGTSLPELSVSVTASINNANSLAISNVVGSNLFNLMVVLGASALVCNIPVGRDVLRRDLPFSIFCAVLLAVLGLTGRGLERIDGFILLGLFVAFLLTMIVLAIKSSRAAGELSEEEEYKILPMWKSLLYIVGGAVAIKFGGDWVVDAAVAIAKFLGASETLIGLTIVAVGTSLPELVTSLTAAKKHEMDMAVGNVVGSNVFNILMILGVAASISPIFMDIENVIDIIILVSFSVIILLFSITEKKLERREGIVMLSGYGMFLFYIIVRAYL
ncbi:MAG: calcium/sodium antiporter [Lachnospiraceae bacterium]|nr:calcium/sodium antiporter [Lachnospiraceae bacterium]